MDVTPDHDPDCERGATLIELLVGIVLSSIILAALTGGILVYLRSADGVRGLLSETPELQVAATRFAGDVQSSAVVSTTGGTACGAAVGWTKLVDLTWTDPGTDPALTSDDQTRAVSYTYTSSTHELRRSSCTNGTLLEQTTLISHLNPGSTPMLTTTASQVDLAVSMCATGPTGACLVGTDIPATFTGVRRMS